MIYFLSDAHLGSKAFPNVRQQELRLCRFLDSIKADATAIYFLGDIFDFWFEYRHAIPKGFVRFLGKVAELTDKGIEVHFFIGNHDIWCKDYLAKECGVIMHYEPICTQIKGKTFFLGHGDGLGDPDWKFRFIRGIFHNSLCQWLFRWLHPDLGIAFGLTWAKLNRLKHRKNQIDGQGGDPPYMGEDKEFQVKFAKEYLKENPNVNFFIFGHRHIELDLMIQRDCRLLIIGDWITQFTYAKFDGETMVLDSYDEE